jgi:nicotinamidase-related amidase
MQQHSRRISRAGAGLIVIDVQDRLWPVIVEKDRLLENLVRLVKGAVILGLPIVVTEQYPKGIGATVAELAAALPAGTPIEKLTFSAWGVPAFGEALRARGITEPILCGIEAHVCVCQTCLDLLDAGLRPFVVADAVSSRTAENCRLALERMRTAGAIIVSTEMILFELLERAGTPEFKQILALVK